MASLETIAILRSVAALRAHVRGYRAAGETLALVPTMGALHEGHLALMRAGRALCRRTIASIFVNPAQFGPNEDLASYPRDEAGDLRQAAAEAACDCGLRAGDSGRCIRRASARRSRSRASARGSAAASAPATSQVWRRW